MSANESDGSKLESVTTPDGRTVRIRRAPAIRVTAAGLVTEQDAADYLGCSARTMQRMRQQRYGPKYQLRNGRCWYALADLDDYLRDCQVDPLAG